MVKQKREILTGQQSAGDMNLITLQQKLAEQGIAPETYSLTGELKADSYILYKNYHRWEVFYLDERGSRHDEQTFYTEEEACLYMCEKIIG